MRSGVYALPGLGRKVRIHPQRPPGPRGGNPAESGPPLPGSGPPRSNRPNRRKRPSRIAQGWGGQARRARYLIASSFFLSVAIVLSERCPGGIESAIAIASSSVLRACAVSASPA